MDLAKSVNEPTESIFPTNGPLKRRCDAYKGPTGVDSQQGIVENNEPFESSGFGKGVGGWRGSFGGYGVEIVNCDGVDGGNGDWHPDVEKLGIDIAGDGVWN